MIDIAIAQIASSLNQSLRRTFDASEDLVVVSSLHEHDGSVATPAINRLSVFLVNIERDTLPQQAGRPAGGDRVALAPPPVCLNLMLMFAAHFAGSTYAEALKLVSAAIGFFQSRPLFDRHNTPELEPGIDRLALDIENLGFGDLGNVWGLLGGRYVPSVLYRVRMVSIDTGRVQAEVPRILQPAIALGR
jgi:hypothetical protein